jgi:hypothetical protein
MASGPESHAIPVGDVAPDFALPDRDGTVRWRSAEDPPAPPSSPTSASSCRSPIE